MLTLSLFGSPEIKKNNQPLTTFRSIKSVALLTYLVLEPQPHSRASLAALLWGESDEVKARRNLSQTFNRLLGDLDEAQDGESVYFQITRPTLGMQTAAPIECDATTFEGRLRQVAVHSHEALDSCPDCLTLLRGAVGSVSGQLLQGFEVGAGGEQFEEWLLFRREQLHQQMLDTLLTLTTVAIGQQAYGDAIAYARRQLALEAWREVAHRQLIKALALDGQREAALAQFERCQSVLQGEMGVGVSAETQTLLTAIRNSTLTQPNTHTAPQSNSNLPSSTTPFVGRETEIAAIAERLLDGDYRLVTLLGQGGIGKTRLALETGRRLVASSNVGGVYFVSLVGVDSAENIPPTIADALGVTLTGQKSTADQVRDWLRHRSKQKPIVLILDNFEQLSDKAHWLLELLQTCAKLRLLVTSRERLRLLAEDVIALTGLTTPTESVPVSKALDFDATRLFIDRARRVEKRFRLSAGNWSHLIAICQQLDGLPLGIELAASWVEELSLQDIADGLGELDFLETDLRDVPRRQRSMRGVYQTSWRRLSSDEQAALTCLSVMRGTFDGKAALAVAQTTSLVLRQLRHKSLLRAPRVGWLDMHELVRQFSAEKKQDTSADLQHADYYLNLVAAESTELDSTRAPQAIKRIQPNIENIRLGWQTALRHSNWRLLDHAAGGFMRYLRLTGLLQNGMAICRQAIQLTETQPDASQLRNHLKTWLANFLCILYRPEAIEVATSVLHDLPGASHPNLHTFNHYILAYINALLERYTEAEAHAVKAIALAQAHQFHHLEVQTLETMGHAAFIQNRLADSQALYERAVAKIEQTDTGFLVYDKCIGSLGNIFAKQGMLSQAMSYHERHVALSREQGARRSEGVALHWQSYTSNIIGLFEQTVALERHAFQLFQELGDESLQLNTQTSLALALRQIGKVDEALSAAQHAFALSAGTSSQMNKGLANLAMGQVFAELGRDGRAYFAAAAGYFGGIGRADDVLQCDAWRAHCELKHGSSAEAVRIIEPVIEQLHVAKYEHQLEICWLGYEILHDTGQDARAYALLQIGQQQLQLMIEKIDDPNHRDAFLKIPAVRSLVAKISLVEQS